MQVVADVGGALLAHCVHRNVDVPASLPYVTGVGGTEFNEGNGAFWQAATNKTDVLTSALSYIPEKVWNDSSSTNGLSAGGGGASTMFGKSRPR